MWLGRKERAILLGYLRHWWRSKGCLVEGVCLRIWRRWGLSITSCPIGKQWLLRLLTCNLHALERLLESLLLLAKWVLLVIETLLLLRLLLRITLLLILCMGSLGQEWIVRIGRRNGLRRRPSVGHLLRLGRQSLWLLLLDRRCNSVQRVEGVG